MTILAVIPTTFQTDRQDVHDLLVSMGQQWIVYCQTNFTGLHAGTVRKVWHTLPEDLSGEGPFIYISEIHEMVIHDGGIRTSTFEGGVGYVDTLGDPEETDSRINAFSDFMRDVFTANARTIEQSYATAGGPPHPGMFEQIGARDENPLHEGPYPFGHFMVTWRYVVQGGYR